MVEGEAAHLIRLRSNPFGSELLSVARH
jgi:hypothetical protein